jgi:hypothetical protein
MTKLQIMIVDAETNDSVLRDMTEEEFLDFSMSIEDSKARKDEAKAKLENAKKALMDLGLTEEIANQIVGIPNEPATISD